MDQTDMIIMVIGLFISIGAFLGTGIVAMLVYFVKRLISSMDDLSAKMEEMRLDMTNRPDRSWVTTEAEKQAKTTVILHENKKH